MTNPTQRMQELLDNQFRLLEERIEYNRHDMGEMGMFIRVGYVKNFLEDTKAEALAELSKLMDKVRIDEVENFETGREEHIAFTYKINRLAVLQQPNQPEETGE